MRFLCLYRGARPETTPTTPDEMMRMGQLIDEMTRAGVLLASEGCQPSAKGARVRLEKGAFTVVDGPFSEAKEIVGGFAMIQAASRVEAIHWVKRFLEVAGDGETEIRQIHEPSDFDPEALQACETAARGN